jgi:hypothetical protein
MASISSLASFMAVLKAGIKCSFLIFEKGAEVYKFSKACNNGLLMASIVEIDLKGQYLVVKKDVYFSCVF